MEEADRIWALCTALRIEAEVGGVRLLVDEDQKIFHQT